MSGASEIVALIRHADAGDRAEWEDDDTLRPLTRRGGRQAEALAAALRGVGFARLMSSRYLRCVQTLEPLGTALTLTIDLDDALAEGAPPDATLALLGGLTGGPTALCTHGDVVGNVCEELVARGLVDAGEVRLRKASTWLLRLEGGEIAKARYLPPPA